MRIRVLKATSVAAHSRGGPDRLGRDFLHVRPRRPADRQGVRRHNDRQVPRSLLELVERDGDHCIAEYDANDTLLRKYIHGPAVDEPICLIEVADSNATYYYHYDALGSVVALTDADANAVQLYEYSVYGRVAASDPNHTNPFLFTGRRFDGDTGLYYYRARYYNPYIGRFLQTDPIGYGGGMNVYRYCKNSPLAFVDPRGLSPTYDFSEGGSGGDLFGFFISESGIYQLIGGWNFDGAVTGFEHNPQDVYQFNLYDACDVCDLDVVLFLFDGSHTVTNEPVYLGLDPVAGIARGIGLPLCDDTYLSPRSPDWTPVRPRPDPKKPCPPFKPDLLPHDPRPLPEQERDLDKLIRDSEGSRTGVDELEPKSGLAALAKALAEWAAGKSVTWGFCFEFFLPGYTWPSPGGCTCAAGGCRACCPVHGS